MSIRSMEPTPSLRESALPDSSIAIGIDIGGTKTAAVAIDGTGAVLASTVAPTLAGVEGVLGTAQDMIAALADQLGVAVDSFVSVGIGVPGQVNRPAGVVHYSYNMGVSQLALAPKLAERTGLEVSLDNDVTAAAIGAAHLMELSGQVIYLNMGTGLAAGIVEDGAPWRGANDLAGEVGHLAIDARRRPCPCGQFGCLETVASGSALLKHWPEGGEHPGRVLAERVGSGDEDARQALELLIEGAATAIRVLGMTLNPETIVIGGGLRKVGAPLLDGIRAQLSQWGDASEFVAGFQLDQRIAVLPDSLPAATVGAALSARY